MSTDHERASPVSRLRDLIGQYSIPRKEGVRDTSGSATELYYGVDENNHRLFLNIPLKVILLRDNNHHYNSQDGSGSAPWMIVGQPLWVDYSRLHILHNSSHLRIVTSASILGQDLDDLSLIARLLAGEAIIINELKLDRQGCVGKDPNRWVELSLPPATRRYTMVNIEATVIGYLESRDNMASEVDLTEEFTTMITNQVSSPGSILTPMTKQLIDDLIRCSLGYVRSRPYISAEQTQDGYIFKLHKHAQY